MSEDIFTILDEIITPYFKIQNSGGVIKIEEKQAPKCKFVEIQTSKKIFALSLDQNRNVFNCFEDGVKNINKKNDAIIFFIKKDSLIVLLIELKSDNRGKYLKQLKAGRNFVEYLLRQIDLFYNIKIDPSKIVYRGILFQTQKSPPKGTTRKEGLYFRDRNGLYCASLACNTMIKLQKIKDSISI